MLHLLSLQCSQTLDGTTGSSGDQETDAGILQLDQRHDGLSGLTGLTRLYLGNNLGLSDIQSLLDNAGLGVGDIVALQSTSVSRTDVAALQAKGVTVLSDCP